MSEHDTGQFDPWDADHTALVHALWAAKHDGLTIKDDFDAVASKILGSRWLKAYKAKAQAEALRDFAPVLAGGWRLDLDRLWKPAENEVWVKYLRAEADRIERGNEPEAALGGDRSWRTNA